MARRGRMGRGVAPTEKAKDFKGTMKKLIRYMASFKIQIFFVAVFAICGTIFNIAGPKILGNSTGLQPISIIFAITVGGALAGPLGMFLGVPIVAVLTFLINKLINYILKKKHIEPDLSIQKIPGLPNGRQTTHLSTNLKNQIQTTNNK